MLDAPLSWRDDGKTWPNREYSQFIKVGRTRWHVQKAGGGPNAILLHGTGSATHTWKGLLPLLRDRMTVIAPDLPGHGFTSSSPSHQMSLPAMARSVSQLLQKLDVSDGVVVGHSAGAAIAAQMAKDGTTGVAGIVSINGAMLPLNNLPGLIFSPLAKLLAMSRIVPWLFSLRAADRTVVERLLRQTGSQIDRESIDLYVRLARNPGHVGGALNMMANWDLQPLKVSLPALEPSILFLVGDRDKTVPPSYSESASKRAPNSHVKVIAKTGHLTHEEEPASVASEVFWFAEQIGALEAVKEPERSAIS